MTSSYFTLSDVLSNFILSLLCLVANLPRSCSFARSLNISKIMKDIYYSLIVLLPAIVSITVSCVVVYVVGRNDASRRERFRRWVVTNIFSGIIKKKTKNSDETRWIFKDVDLTEEQELLSKVFFFLLALCLLMIGNVAMMFWQILLLDVTYSCEQNSEKTKDCFEYHLWNSEAFRTFSRDPIDCNTAAIQNGTVQVVCYKLVFNIGIASGASYGGFKIAMALLNVATTLMLMATKPKTVRRIKTIVFLVYLVFFGTIIAIQATSLGVTFMSDNLVIILQMVVAIGIVGGFVFCFPWNDFIALRERNDEQATRLENPAVNVADDVV